MAMPGRKFTATSEYRYGFNGKENDADISEGGYDFGDRIYDARINRWLSVDPLQKDYPSESPYIFAGNSPIGLIDVGGKYKYIVHALYDAEFKKYTIISVMRVKGLKAVVKEYAKQAFRNSGSRLVKQKFWHDYISFDIQEINNNKGIKVDSKALQPDVTVGRTKFVTEGDALFGNSDEIWARLNVSDNRGGIMLTSSTNKGNQGAGVWGDASAIVNIDEFNEFKKKWEEHAPPESDNIIDAAKKLVEIVSKLSDPPPAGHNDISNKQEDTQLEVDEYLDKINPPESVSNEKTTKKASRDTVIQGKGNGYQYQEKIPNEVHYRTRKVTVLPKKNKK